MKWTNNAHDIQKLAEYLLFNKSDRGIYKIRSHLSAQISHTLTKKTKQINKNRNKKLWNVGAMFLIIDNNRVN